MVVASYQKKVKDNHAEENRELKSKVSNNSNNAGDENNTYIENNE